MWWGSVRRPCEACRACPTIDFIEGTCDYVCVVLGTRMGDLTGTLRSAPSGQGAGASPVRKYVRMCSLPSSAITPRLSNVKPALSAP